MRPTPAGVPVGVGAPDPELDDFVSVLCRNTGQEINRLTWEKRQGELRLLKDQTRVLADRLEQGGVNTRGDGQVALVGVVTGQVQELESWRNINLLPVVAQRNRNDILNDFKYFSSTHSYLRYFVVTSGVRCPVEEIGERLKWLHSHVRRFGVSKLAKENGVELVLRADEVTIKRGADGLPSYHVHLNLVLDFKRRLGSSGYSEFMKGFHEFFGGVQLKDCGKIVDSREVVKYVTKPADVMSLEVEELVALHHQLFRCHLVQPMGEFKRLRDGLRQGGVRMRQRPVVRDGIATHEWVREKRWERVKHGVRCDCERCRLADVARDFEREDVSPPSDQVLSITRPAPFFTNRCEPAVVVRNYSGSFERLVEVNSLHDVVEVATAAWVSTLDTSTISVPEVINGDEMKRLQLSEGCSDFDDLPPDEALYWSGEVGEAFE